MHFAVVDDMLYFVDDAIAVCGGIELPGILHHMSQQIC